jgi:hypothetical protein
MSDFHKALLGDMSIPFNDAAEFFLGVRNVPRHGEEKTASMADAPDTTGVLEGAFEVSPEQVAALLQNCIGKALALAQASMVYSSNLRGPMASLASRHVDQTWSYRDIVNTLSRRASTLAGAVHIPDVEPPPATTNPEAAIRSMIRGEQELIQSFNELRRVCGENPLGHYLGSLASSAQQRMDDCWAFLTPEAPEAEPLPAAPEGLAEHEESETPEEEAAESPEFQAAEEAAGVEEPVEPEKTAGKVINFPGGAAGRAVAKAKTKAKDWTRPAMAGTAVGGVAGLAVGAPIGAANQRAKDDSIARSHARRSRAALEKEASIRFKFALFKLANEGAFGDGAPMASPTATGQLEPTNYLAAELAGRQAQEQQESAYYRSQVQQAQQEAQAGQAQMQELAAQMEQLQMQQQQTEAMIQQSQMQAVQAQDEALRQTQAAANMRMGMQQMRAQLMEIASHDPAAEAAATMQGPAGQPGMEGGVPGSELGGPAPQEGPAGMAPDQPMAPGAAPPNGGIPSAPPETPQGLGGADHSTMAPTGAKVASALEALKQRLPGILGGGVAGAAFHHSLKNSVPELRNRVQTLSAEQGGFLHAMRLAKEKAHLHQAERAEQHPEASLLYNTARGALVGGAAGPAIQSNIKSLFGQ